MTWVTTAKIEVTKVKTARPTRTHDLGDDSQDRGHEREDGQVHEHNLGGDRPDRGREREDSQVHTHTHTTWVTTARIEVTSVKTARSTGPHDLGDDRQDQGHEREDNQVHEHTRPG